MIKAFIYFVAGHRVLWVQFERIALRLKSTGLFRVDSTVDRLLFVCLRGKNESRLDRGCDDETMLLFSSGEEVIL